MNIIIALLIFTVIIVIHELGHFLLAKKNGIFVTEFSVGMGPRLITLVKTANGYRPRFLLSQHDFEHTQEWRDTTKYSWKVFPIGGSCMMLGEDESIEDDRAFNKKGVWARISVTLAGPIFNFILAFILAMVLIGIIGYDPAKIYSVEDNSPASEVGLEKGDLITEVNGSHIDNARDFDTYFHFNPLNAQDIELTYIRGGKKIKAIVRPSSEKLYRIGLDYNTAISAEDFTITKNLPLEEAGLTNDDIITKINGVKVNTGEELAAYMKDNPLTEKPVSITYARDGVENTIEVIPISYVLYNTGFAVYSVREKTDVLGVIKYSALEVKYQIVSTVGTLGQLINGKVSRNDLAGPVGIVNFIGDAYETSKSEGALTVFINLVFISILLSGNLGVMNLLPIPALDGGRLVFLILEVFRGKPIDQSKEGLVHMIGFVALMILMVFVMFNDFRNIF